MSSTLLDGINNPTDLKSLSIEELKSLAREMRTQIIEVMAVNGGHLASNLGSVEIILALHYVFNTPLDKLIFDTSHQTYPHKLVTGRKERFHTIRKWEGLCGFCHPGESPYDHFYAGHAGTALSLALGMAKSRDLNEGNEHIIPVISDAPLACGLTLEALNHISPDMKRFLLVLNDNAMAISNGVGTIHHNILGKFVMPRQANKEAKAFFECFGLDYVGPVDGHDIKALIDTLTEIKESDHPIVLHTLTIKGHGMPQAMKDPITYHGVRPFDPESGKFHPVPATKPTFPKIFGKHLLAMATDDSSIVAITPAMPEGSCLTQFMEQYPTRCLDVGIAEGHAVTFAAGLAYQSQKKVVAVIYATFFQRALDNLFQDVCLQGIPLLFALDRGGLSPADGTTHHGIFDISFMNAMPGMVIVQPRDGSLLKDLLESAFTWQKPVALRYPNMTTTENCRAVQKRELGKGEILAQGKDIVLIGLGHMCITALEVRDLLLERGISCTVVDPIFVKPLDKELFLELMLNHQHFVTIEEHAVSSGLGSIINSFVMQSNFPDIQVQNFGIPDSFIEHGSYNDLIDAVGLTPQAIVDTILNRLGVGACI